MNPSEAKMLTIPEAVASLESLPMEEPPEYKRPNVRQVPEYLVPAVMAIIEKVNRKAAKIGAPGFTVIKGAPYEVERKTDDGQKYLLTMVSITVEGEPVKMPGFELVGRVDFEDGMVLVNARPGAEIPSRYRCATPACDHCKVERQRSAVFIFKADAGGHIQVGRSCLKDFMGYDPAAALWSAGEWGGLFEDIDEELERGAGGARAFYKVPLSSVMLAAVVSVRLDGFVSRKIADEQNRCSTASAVSEILFGKSDSEISKAYRAALSDDDKAKAEAVVAWVLEAWGGLADLSDYQYNAVELCRREAVAPRRIGLLVSLVAAYNREMEEQVARSKRVNAWIGKPGDKLEFEGVYSGENWFETAYGPMVIARFDTPAGLVVYKGSTLWWPTGIKAGDAIKFCGTVKALDDYKGTKQTLVIRCKLGGLPVKAKKGKAAAAVAA